VALLPWLLAAALAAATAPHVAEAAYALRTANALARGAGRAPGDAAPAPSREPLVSVVVAARDEAAGIAATVRALRAQDLPGLEVVVVDDRSTDGTGALVDALAAEPAGHPVRALHVRELPPGWLGKNHALWRGAALARGRWLLFTDGDVWLHPGAVRVAVGFAEARRLDHLTLGPALRAPGYALQAWIALALLAILTFLSPRAMNRPRSGRGYGVGAFNLVRRSAYEAIGTHRAIALRPDDDLRLGLRLRRAGFRQWAAAEPALVSVQWYPTLGAAIRGLEKNAFAVLGYRPALLAAAVAGLLALFLGPLLGAAAAPGGAAWLFAAVAAAQWAAVAAVAATFVVPGRPARAAAVALAYAPAALAFAYAMARSGAIALLRGSVQWRGTRYPLQRLRGQTGLEGTPPPGRGS
jgi:hypothetical protein